MCLVRRRARRAGPTEAAAVELRGHRNLDATASSDDPFAPRADGRPSGKVWHHVRGESWRLSSSFRSPIISSSMPASRYCPIRSIASDTGPTKPGDDSRAERGSCSARFAVTAASVHARSHAWTWVFSIFSQSRPPKRAGQIPPRRPLSRGLPKPPEVFASCRGLGTRLG